MKSLLLLLLRAEVKWRITIAGRDRQERCEKGNGVTEVVGCLTKHSLQLVKALLVRVLAPESSCPFESSDRWIERAVLVMGRAEGAQACVWLAAEPLHNGLSDARFADAWLAREQHHAALSALCPVPAAQQQVDLFVAADERRLGRVQGLEPAHRGARA